METIERCDLCGAHAFAPAYTMPDVHLHPDEWFQVVACQGCGLGFVNPRPARAEMGRYYPSGYYHLFFGDKAANERRYARQARFLDGITGTDGARPRVLDVGCADGAFPRFLRDQRGLDAEGLEPHASAGATGADDLVIHHADLTQAGLPPASYDAITAWAVFEHLHTPAAYFAEVSRLLRPGGRFVFLVTDFDSISSRYLFREDPPRHLFFFTADTVRRYLEGAGLQLRSRTADDAIYAMEPVYWLSHHLRRITGRGPLQFADLPPLPRAWAESKGLAFGPVALLRYALAHPLALLDRLGTPLYARWQKATGRYGIVTYVAGKAP